MRFYLKKTKKKKREEAILKEYENERVLQVDNHIDNKKYLKDREINE